MPTNKHGAGTLAPVCVGSSAAKRVSSRLSKRGPCRRICRQALAGKRVIDWQGKGKGSRQTAVKIPFQVGKPALDGQRAEQRVVKLSGNGISTAV